MPTIPETLAYVILATPLPCTLVFAGSALLVAAGVQAWKWQTLARQAQFVSEQPVQKLADAAAELAAGRRRSIAGVFEGYIACNSTPPLSNASPSRVKFHSHVCYAEKIECFTSLSSFTVSESFSEVPFEICDRSLGNCVHVFSRPGSSVFFRKAYPAMIVRNFQIDYPPHPLLRCTENYLHVGDWVTALGELSLSPWMSSTDLRPVLRAPESQHSKLPDRVILHAEGKMAISEALKTAGQVHRHRASILLALAAGIFTGAWVVYKRRTLRNMAIIDDIQEHARRLLQNRHERHQPSASPILRPCSVCQVRSRDCVLRDCNHQVCCMECARGLLAEGERAATHAAATTNHPSLIQENGRGPEAGRRGMPACPLCAAPVRDILRVYTA